jgi:hypothetical protein
MASGKRNENHGGCWSLDERGPRGAGRQSEPSALVERRALEQEPIWGTDRHGAIGADHQLEAGGAMMLRGVVSVAISCPAE